LKRCERHGLTVELKDAKFCPIYDGRLSTVIPRLDAERRILIALAALILAVTVILFGLIEHVPLTRTPMH